MTTLQNVTAAVLAGGLGTRLRSVVQDRPKVLAEVAGRPLLAYLLDQLASAGVCRVVLCTGYMAELVRDVMGDTHSGMDIVYSQEPTGLGTGGALRHAYSLLHAETSLVLNGDSCCRANLSAFASWHLARSAEASVLLTQVDDARRFGRTRIDAACRVQSFSEKTAETGPGWINAGIYLLQTRLLFTIPANTPVSLEREVFPAWTKRRFFGYQTRAPFLDIGTPESYARAETFFRHLDDTTCPVQGPHSVLATVPVGTGRGSGPDRKEKRQ
jgi:NDP-sugar pyrophosphorylase family protein